MDPLTTTVASPPFMRSICPVTAMLVRETEGSGMGTFVPVRLLSSFLRLIVSPFLEAPLSKSFMFSLLYRAKTSTKMLPWDHWPVKAAITFLLLILNEKMVFRTVSTPGMNLSLLIGAEKMSTCFTAQLTVMF